MPVYLCMVLSVCVRELEHELSRFSHIQLFATLWTVACQVPLSMGCVCEREHELSRFSHIPLFATLWTVACQVPLSMGFSRQEYWSTGLPCPALGDLPDPGI